MDKLNDNITNSIIDIVGNMKVVLHIPFKDFVNIRKKYRSELLEYYAENETLELINQQVGQISNHQ